MEDVAELINFSNISKVQTPVNDKRITLFTIRNIFFVVLWLLIIMGGIINLFFNNGLFRKSDCLFYDIQGDMIKTLALEAPTKVLELEALDDRED